MLSKSLSPMSATSMLAIGLTFLFAISGHTGQFPESKAAELDKKIPAYHEHAPTTAIPNTMSPGQFKDTSAKVCYKKAGKMKNALYQMPCYCHCDRHFGHKSLLDCFVTNHGSVCDTCQRELLYVNEQLKKGTSISQIRKEIIDQKWGSIYLDRYLSK